MNLYICRNKDAHHALYGWTEDEVRLVVAKTRGRAKSIAQQIAAKHLRYYGEFTGWRCRCIGTSDVAEGDVSHRAELWMDEEEER